MKTPTVCGCMRYPSSPCSAETDALLCPECIDARCVLVQWQDDAGKKEHICVIGGAVIASSLSAVRMHGERNKH